MKTCGENLWTLRVGAQEECAKLCSHMHWPVALDLCVFGSFLLHDMNGTSTRILIYRTLHSYSILALTIHVLVALLATYMSCV